MTAAFLRPMLENGRRRVFLWSRRPRPTRAVASMSHPTLLRHAIWLVLFFALFIPVRVVFGVLLPPILRYFWHNRSFIHLAQDDRPVYESVECVATNLKYGQHPYVSSRVRVLAQQPCAADAPAAPATPPLAAVKPWTF
jgi:hypothetical protein